MEELKGKISILKEKIRNEIIKKCLQGELKFLYEFLLAELNGYEYDENDINSLNNYYSWLQAFNDNKIQIISEKVQNKKYDSVFDNSEEGQISKIKELKKTIEDLLKCFKSSYPVYGESILKQYTAINDFYQEEFKIIIEKSRRLFGRGLGFIEDPEERVIFDPKRPVIISKNPIFILYQDTKSLRNAHIRDLEKIISACEEMTAFVDRDAKIREVFDRAKSIIKDDSLIGLVHEIEENYDQGVRACIDNVLSLRSLDKVLESAEKSCKQIESMIAKEKEKNNYCKKINEMTLDTDLDTILDIQKYVETNHVFEDMFYRILYDIVEKEKYAISVFSCEPRIYPRLSDKTKIRLESIFLENLLSEHDEGEISRITEMLSKNGYLSVMDKKRVSLFEQQQYDNSQDYGLKELGPIIYGRKSNFDVGTDRFLKDVSEMTLNCNLEDVLSNAKECEKRDRLEVSFYKVLYAILEKEKYLQNKYGYHSIVIENLSNRSKAIIKRMFSVRMKEQLEGESVEDIDYETTLDREYESFFDKSEFTKKLWFSATPVPEDRFKWRLKGSAFKKRRYVLVDRETGEEKVCPLEVPSIEKLPESVFNVILYPQAGCTARDVYNQKFELLDNFVSKCYIDYTKGYILIIYVRSEDMYVYDRDFNLIKVIDGKKFPRLSRENTFANDGVLTIIDSDSVTYRDYFTMEIIDSFHSTRSSSDYMYNDGLYNFCDKETGLFGYKDISGNVIIKPRFTWAAPFLNKVAYTVEKDGHYNVRCFFIDREGTRYNIGDCASEMMFGSSTAVGRQMKYFEFWSHTDRNFRNVKCDLAKQMYIVTSISSAGVIGNEWYVINNDTPIININFGGSDKGNSYRKDISQ